MATVNLGRIKPVFRGAYSGSTAYVVDDIVTSGGSTYICIQAHGAGTQAVSQTAYWTLMAEGGDVASTLTTQGDVLYRDGSGLQRLAAGTSGQLLQSGGSGANVSWTDPPVGSILKTVFKTIDDRSSISSSSGGIWNASSLSFTPTAANSYLHLEMSINISSIGTSQGGYFYDTTNSSYVSRPSADGSRLQLNFRTSVSHSSAWMTNSYVSGWTSAGSTNARTYAIYLMSHGATTFYLNRANTYNNNANDADQGITASTFKITEYANAIGTFSGGTNS